MKFFIFLINFVFCFCSFGDLSTGVKAYMIQNNLSPDFFGYRGAPAQLIVTDKGTELFWDKDFLAGVPPPSLDSLPTNAVYILQEYEAFKLLSLQNAKPIEQKQYENAFFELTEQLLTALDDPRGGETPPVKLSFPEIDAILEQLFETDLSTATRASIKLLGIDAALKRYNTLWWDDAIQHELPEE